MRYLKQQSCNNDKKFYDDDDNDVTVPHLTVWTIVYQLYELYPNSVHDGPGHTPISNDTTVTLYNCM